MALAAIGYTEHSFAHVEKAAHTAAMILETLEYPARQVELAKIAGFLHDIGNVINRTDHAQSGAVMAFRLLDRLEMPVDEICSIISAIGNHDDKKALVLDLKIDTEISSVLEYFEIFMERMLLSKRAALFFDKKFKMYINGSNIL